MRFFIVLLLALVCSGSLRSATTPEKQLKTFIEVARAAASKLPPAAPAETDSRLRPALSSVPAMLDYLERMPAPVALESVQSAVVQISTLLASSAKVKKAGDALIATLTADRNDRIARYRAEVDALLAKSAQACLAATKPADLDEPLKTLAPYQRPDEQARRGGIDSGAQQRASQMFQFVTRWQDFLGASQAGDADRTRQALWELRNLVDPSLIPRSMLFALPAKGVAAPTTAASTSVESPQDALPAILASLEKATSLEDLEPIAKDLGTLVKANTNNASLREFWNAVSGYVADWKNLGSGYVNIDLFARNERLSALRGNPCCSEAATAVLLRLAVQLKVETLRSVFKDSGLPPAADESVDAYILRVAQAAAAAENWEYTQRTLEFYRALFPYGFAPAWVARELQSCTTYVAARQLDEARQISQAVLAYQEALRTTGRLTPVALISARLAEIKAKQPEAFEFASRLPAMVSPMPPNPMMQNRFNQPPVYGREPSTYLMPRAERPFTP